MDKNIDGISPSYEKLHRKSRDLHFKYTQKFKYKIKIRNIRRSCHGEIKLQSDLSVFSEIYIVHMIEKYKYPLQLVDRNQYKFYTMFDTYFKAIGGGVREAASAGIRTKHTKFLVYFLDRQLLHVIK